jgi:hypothetical protein
MEPIAVEEGLDLLEQLLQEGRSRVTVLPSRWEQSLAHEGSRPLLTELLRGARNQVGAPDLAARARAAAVPERLELLIDHVERQAALVLGLKAGRLADRQKGFFDLGMDSLMAVDLRNRLQVDLGSDVVVESTAIFDYPTAELLGCHLHDSLFPALAEASSANQEMEDPQEHEALQSLSDDDLGQMLDERIEKIMRE